ncbi:MAG: C4-type zinc ribbon domain-containing protein [Pseudomonadota bacterium]
MGLDEITKEDIRVLVDLQKAETEIVRLESVLSGFEKEKLALEKTLTSFSSSLEEHRSELAKLASLCRETEAEIQMIDQRIKKSNEHLRMVKTNKEYQALQREVDDSRKRKEQLENIYLQTLDEKEKMAALVQEREAEMLQLSSKIRGDQETIDQKSLDDRGLLANYVKQREDIGRSLDSGLFEKFTEISRSSGGLAVVQVIKEVCRGCYMNIPPQLFIEVQRCNSLILCPQCNRILYYKVPE